MHLRKKSGSLMGFLLAILLTACAAATVIGAGCSAYAEMRLSMPTYDADFVQLLDQEPTPLLVWVNLLDARMTGACTL